MKSPSPDFLWGHPWTPPLHLCSPPSHSLPLSPISAPLRPQFSPIGPCFSPSPPPSPRGTSWLLGTPPRVSGVPFWWHLEPYYKWRSWPGWWWGCGIHTAAWEQCTRHMRETNYEGNYEKKIIISIIKNYSPWGVCQAGLPGAHTPLTGVRILYHDCSTSAVPLPSLLRRLLPLLVSSGNFLVFGPYDLGSFSPLQ